MKKNKILIGTLCLAMCFSLAACSKSDSSDSSSSSANNELKVYIDDAGPYYIDEEDEIVRFKTERDYPADDFSGDSENTSEPIYGTYDETGIKYTLGDGWYTDNSFGVPMIYQDNSQSGNEYLVLTDASMVTEGDYKSISKDSISKIFDGYIEDGQIVSYEIEEIKDVTKANDMDAKGFKIIVESEDYVEDTTIEDETDETDEQNSSKTEDGSSSESKKEAKVSTTKYYSEYIFIDAYKPYALIVNADNNDDSIKNVDSVRDDILSTLELKEVEVTDEGEEITVE